MTEHQELFLVQARSSFAVFGVLRVEKGVHHCHALHYLQMVTELLGKAYSWRKGAPKKRTHRALVTFLRELTANPQAQKQLGFAGKNEYWKHLLRKSIPLAEQIEDLAPAIANLTNSPNPEYPWPLDDPKETPATFEFPLWVKLQKADGRQFLKLLTDLFTVAEAYL